MEPPVATAPSATTAPATAGSATAGSATAGSANGSANAGSATAGSANGSAPNLVDTATDHAADLAAIREVIADVERAFNTNDPALAVRHFARDAWAVAVTGTRVVGLEALLEAHRVGFAGPLRDQYARYEVADVAFVRPDVALVHKRARAVDADGTPLDVGHAMVALYVLVREDGRWWIAARQNTLVAAT